MVSENREKKPIVIERRRGKDRKKTPRLTKTYDVTVIPATVGIAAETEEPPKKRVAAYCRVSTDQEAQETSLEEQMAHFNTVIAEHPDWELAGIYTDAAVIIGLKTLRLKKCWKFGAFWAFSHKICE